MKIIKCSALWLAILCSCSAYAAQDVALVRSDESIKEFQRQVMLVNPENGYEALTVEAKVSFCPMQAPVCIPSGTWTLDLSTDLIAGDAGNLAQWVGLNRFDKLSLSPEAIILSAPYGNVQENQAGAVTHGGLSPYADFRAGFEKALNERAAGISTVLANAVEVRARSLRDKEEGTAMTGRLKSLGLDVETLKNMMDDGFAVAAYVPKVSATVTISETKVKVPFTDVETTQYSVTMIAPVTVKMVAYRLDANTRQFVPYKEWVGESGSMVMANDLFIVPPVSASQVKDLFKRSYSGAYKAAVLHLATQMKRDPNFTLATKVTEAHGSDFKSNLHAGLDLRVDSLWTIERSMDGQKKRVGFGKARQVAKAPVDDAEVYSGFASLQGRVEQGDQLTEFPWQGAQAYLGIGSINYDLISIGDSTLILPNTSGTTKQKLAAWQVGTAVDLGYMQNSESLSEVWLTSDLTLAMGNSGFTLAGIKMEAPVLLALGVGMGKSFYLGNTGISLTPSAGIGFSILAAAGTGSVSGNSYTLSLEETTFKPGVVLDYLLDDFSAIRISVESPQQLSNSGTLQNTTTKTKYKLTQNHFGQGTSVFVTYRWNMESLGMLSGFMR